MIHINLILSGSLTESCCFQSIVNNTLPDAFPDLLVFVIYDFSDLLKIHVQLKLTVAELYFIYCCKLMNCYIYQIMKNMLSNLMRWDIIFLAPRLPFVSNKNVIFHM